MKILDGRAKVDIAGTSKQLVTGINAKYGRLEFGTVPRFAPDLVITADEENSGTICIGGEHVIAASATRSCMEALSKGQKMTLKDACLCEVYYDGDAAGDEVYFGFIPRDK